jgi:hypothetical protein
MIVEHNYLFEEDLEPNEIKMCYNPLAIKKIKNLPFFYYYFTNMSQDNLFFCLDISCSQSLLKLPSFSTNAFYIEIKSQQLSP